MQVPDGLDPELVERLVSSGGGELAVRMGIEFLELSASHSVARMPVEGNRQVVGLLHGGAHVVLGESLGSVSSAIHAGPGDFIHIPRGTVHSLKNEGDRPARALVIVSPAGPRGLQQFFEESFTPVTDRSVEAAPPVGEALVGRMMAAGARNGLEVVVPW